MLRRIPLHVCQILPGQWKDTINQVESEEQLTRQDWMDDEFYMNYRVNINTRALTYAAMHAFGSTDIPKITFKGAGTFNHIFCIEFPGGFRVCARIPKQDARNGSIAATVAMMTMSRLVRRCPVPEVFAWHEDLNNPVGAPYMLLEWVESPEPWEKWSNLSLKDLEKLMHELASQHANFAYPLRFPGYGSVYFAKSLSKGDVNVDLSRPLAYELGPLSRGPRCTAHRGIDIWPQTTPLSLRDFWKDLWQHEVDFMKRTHGSDGAKVIATDKHPSPLIRDTYTLGQFMDTADNLRVLIENYDLPSHSQLYDPCLVSADYRFSNIKIDPQTLKVSAFIDWDEVYIMPFLLCSRFPEEFCSSDGADERWQKTGAFPFLPVHEVADAEADEADSDDSSDSEKHVAFGYKTDSEEDTDSDGSESLISDSDAPSPPRTPSPVPGHDAGDQDRLRRITYTRLRQQYAQTLIQYDSRYGTEGFWQTRQEPLKIQHLVTHGWIEWLSRSEWLKERAGQLTESKN